MKQAIRLMEERINSVVRTTLNEYLDKKIMMPLKKYLDNAPQKYKTIDANELWHLYNIGRRNIYSKHAFSKHEVFKNDWVIHFTNYPFSIIRDGFLGIAKSSKEYLWRTYRRVMPRGYYDGYAFAYDVNDIKAKNAITYGDYALVFRTSGLKVFNRMGDNEWQVIFNNNQANLKECFVLALDKEHDVSFDDIGESHVTYNLKSVRIINPYTRRTICKKDSLNDAVEWIKTNYRQYKSFNAFNNAGKLRKHELEYKKIVQQIIDYVKKNARGDVVVEELPATCFYEAKSSYFVVMYSYGMNLKDFFKEFNLTRTEDYKHYRNEYMTINHENSWSYWMESLWKEKGLDIPEDDDDCHAIYIRYTKL